VKRTKKSRRLYERGLFLYFGAARRRNKLAYFGGETSLLILNVSEKQACLLQDLRNHPRTYGVTAFADCKPLLLFKGDRRDETDGDTYRITGHHHFGALR